jgi:hypothetical protein
MAIKANISGSIDDISRSILNANSTDEKIAKIHDFSNFVYIKTKEDILKDRKEAYRSRFTWLIILLYVASTVIVFLLVIDAYRFDLGMIESNPNGYSRIIDAKVIIALISGVVVQTAASFAILTKYIYGEKE